MKAKKRTSVEEETDLGTLVPGWRSTLRNAGKRLDTAKNKQRAYPWRTCAVGEALGLHAVPDYKPGTLEAAVKAVNPQLHAAGWAFTRAIHVGSGWQAQQALDTVERMVQTPARAGRFRQKVMDHLEAGGAI